VCLNVIHSNHTQSYGGGAIAFRLDRARYVLFFYYLFVCLLCLSNGRIRTLQSVGRNAYVRVIRARSKTTIVPGRSILRRKSMQVGRFQKLRLHHYQENEYDFNVFGLYYMLGHAQESYAYDFYWSFQPFLQKTYPKQIIRDLIRFRNSVRPNIWRFFFLTMIEQIGNCPNVHLVQNLIDKWLVWFNYN